MSDNSNAIANLELSRELYSEEYRKQFFTELQAAQNAECTSGTLLMHARKWTALAASPQSTTRNSPKLEENDPWLLVFGVWWAVPSLYLESVNQE